MTKQIHIWPENAVGSFHVDEQCIDCELCRDNAPEIFARNGVEHYSYVRRQPRTEQERQHCLAAMAVCPVGAIHCDR